MNADGSGKRQLTKGRQTGVYPAWSPDGRRIAFTDTSAAGWGDVAVMRADGSRLTRLTDPPWEIIDTYPTWTPDGSIVFVRATTFGSNFRLMTVDPQSGHVTRVAGAAPTAGGDIALSPDGELIAVSKGETDRLEAVAFPRRGSPVVLLDHLSRHITPNPFAAPSWSPDGGAVAVASGDLTGYYGSRLFVINADGSGLSAVPGVEGAQDPAWRPRQGPADGVSGPGAAAPRLQNWK